MTQPTAQEFPPGIQLLKTLRHHKQRIGHITWSPDGKYLATPSFDKTVGIWDVDPEKLVHVLEGHKAEVSSATWSPNAKQIATASRDRTIQIWNAKGGRRIRILENGHDDLVRHVSWSPDGLRLASASNDFRLVFWNTSSWRASWGDAAADHVAFIAWSPTRNLFAAAIANGNILIYDRTANLLRTLAGHHGSVLSLAWLTDGERLVSASFDGSIRVWNVLSGQQQHMLIAGQDAFTSVTISADGRLMASRSYDTWFSNGSIRIWSTDRWEVLVTIKEDYSHDVLYWHSGIAFHPSDPSILATLGEEDTVIRIWKLDEAIFSGDARRSIRYRNAKVALVGESGVGKSGLALALSGQPFQPTESTHGRHVYILDQDVIEIEGGEEARETNLWDLAGQPGYRLVHQLQLDTVAVALIVFDAGGGGDALGSVRYWYKALLQANRVRGDQAVPLNVFLVAARADRGGATLSPRVVKGLIQELGISAYFETSAKEGWGIDALKEAIRNGIDWSGLPQVNSTQFFLAVKDFLVAQAKLSKLLVNVDDLYQAFIVQTPSITASVEHFAEFNANVRFAEMQGVVKLFSFGNYALLQPEKLDAYASSIVFAAREDVDGFGSINEQDVIDARFRMPESERIQDSQLERLVLIAAVEDLLRHEITFRDGDDLVFPSQLTRESEEMRNPVGASLVLTFAGALQNIYTRLVVRLGRSGIFRQNEIWRNAVTYRAINGICGIVFRELDNGVGEITIFYSDQVGEETRHHFARYIETLLRRLAQTDSVHKQRIITCPECGETLADRQVEKRRERGFSSIECPVCDTKISLLEPEDLLIRESNVSLIDRAANEKRDIDSAHSVVQGKEVVGRFDVFLSHNGKDKAEAIKLKKQLSEHGVLAWLDTDQLLPGGAWMKRLEDALTKCDKLAYLIGEHGRGQWQERELEVFMAQNRPVIPVLLAIAPTGVENTISAFLKTLTWVDFRRADPDPLDQLIWGILGEKAAL